MTPGSSTRRSLAAGAPSRLPRPHGCRAGSRHRCYLRGWRRACQCRHQASELFDAMAVDDAVLPLGLFKISTTASGYGVNVPVVMAGVVFSVVPLLILYLALRRQFVKGIGGFALR
ncbi:MAG: hypothetical protein ACYCXN_10120 [Acidimicrobiales bacterium]|jgi:hypothetical protein